MTIHPLLQFLFAFAFIAALCTLAYKIFCKCIDIIFKSNRSLKYTSFLCALMFFYVGILAFQDFTKAPKPDLSWSFPLMFLCSGIFLFLGTRKLDISKLSQTYVTAEFSEKSAECLLKVLKNARDRLEGQTATANSSIPENYEADSLILDHLITKIKTSLTEPTPSIETSFDFLEAAFIIAALNHEFDSYQESKSSLNEEECNLVTIIRDKIKGIALEEFGDEVLTSGHYQRGK